MTKLQFGLGSSLAIEAGAIPSADYHVGTDGGTIAYTSGTTVTLGGTYPTISSNAQLVYIKVVPTTGDPMYYVQGVNNIKLTHATGVITITGVTAPFASGDVYELGINASFNHWTDIKAVGGEEVAADNAAGAGITKVIPVAGKYHTADQSYADGDMAGLQMNAKGELKVIMSNDIQIGAVEIKDADTENRANVKEADTARTVDTMVLSVQEIGADGTVPPTGSTHSNAPFGKLTDGTSDLTLGTGTVKTIPAELSDGTTNVDVIPTVNSLKEDISSLGGTAVDAANTGRAVTTKVLTTQQVAADGTVPPSGSLNTNAPFAKITDGTSNLTLGTGTVKTVPAQIHDGTTALVLGTGTIKTVPTELSDGTNNVDVIATVNSLKEDISSVGGTAIDAANTGRAVTTKVVTVQEVGADGTVPPTGSLNTNAPFSKLTDGTSNLTLGTGTTKTIPSEIHDGTTGVDVIATVNSLKSDVSSVGGEAVVADNSSGASVTKVIPIGAKYNLADQSYADGDMAMLQASSKGELKVILSTDSEIGSVELKDADTDNRANIKEADTARTVDTLVLAVQEVGADGTVSPTGSLNTNAPFSKITDGSNNVAVIATVNSLKEDVSSVGGTAIDAANSGRAVTTKVVPTQQIAADGTVPPSGSLNTNAPFAKITDGTSNLTLGTGTTKTVPAQIHDGTTALVLGTGTIKTLPTEISDGTTNVDVIPTVNSLKSDVSSLGGTAVNAANTGRTTGTLVLTTQEVGADGTVPPTGSLNTNAPFSKITDGSNNVAVIATVNSLKEDISSLGGTAVDAANTGRAVTTKVLTVQEIGADGTVPPTGSLNTNAPFAKLTDGTNNASFIATINSLKGDVSSVGGEVVVADNGAGAGVTKTIPVGGKYNAAAPTYTDGDVAMNQYDVNGNHKTVEASPLNDHIYQADLVDTTDLPANTYYYPSSSGLSMSGYKDVCFEGVTTGGVTTTIEATLDGAVTPDWIDITLAGYDLLTNSIGNSSFVDKSFILDYDNLNVKTIRVKCVTADATNAVQYNVRQKAI